MRTSNFYGGIMSRFFMFIIFIMPSMVLADSKISVITTSQLKLILDNPQVVVIDVRTSKAWRDSPVKIKGAVRGAPKQFDSWSKDFPRDKALVLY